MSETRDPELLAASRGWGTWASVAAKISIDEALRVIFEQTIHNEHFDADKWSVGTAEDLIHAGEMIKREIHLKKSPNAKLSDGGQKTL